jgi:hypothetical protein
MAALVFAAPFSAQPALAIRPVAQDAAPISIYVSPSGNDSNSGTFAQPLQTLVRAQHVVRALNDNMTTDITVYLENGIYRLTQPMRFGPQDSGTNGYSVVWTSAPGAEAVVSGADQISGWQLSDPSKNIWAAPVPANLRTRQFYVNGMRASLAAGEAPVKLEWITTGYIASSKIMARWRNPSEIDFVYPSQLNFQAEPICPVASIKGKLITMAEPCWNNSNLRRHNIVGWASGKLTTPTYIENAYELLDQPGQFYLDQTAQEMYYIPRKGQDMQTADAEAPALQALVEGAGTKREPVKNITFSNLRFSYATWMQPNTPDGFSEQQSGFTITGKRGYATQGLCGVVPHGTCPYGAWTKEPGNVQFSYDQNLSFINDRFVHLGAAGLNLDNGSQNDAVIDSVFTDISGNGIEAGNVNMPDATGSSQTTGIAITNNHLYSLPAEYIGGVAMLVGYVAGSTISHNQIDHIPGLAISAGWGGWIDKLRQPPVANFSHNNVISDNLIFDFEQTLKDGGGIYTQGIQGTSLATGLEVTGNVIHDQLDWGGALKADNGTTYVTYAGNVLYNDTYDWDGVHWDYRAHPGTKHPTSYDPELLKNNWWQQGGSNYTDKGVTLSGNKIITGPSQAPASVLGTAGLQLGFISLLSWQPTVDAVPNAPQEVSVLYAFRGTAYVTWHPSYVAGSSPVSSYTLYVCRAGTTSCPVAEVQMSTIAAGALDQPGYALISGLSDGQAYSISVTANSAAGSSIPSLPSSDFTPRAYSPGLTGMPTNTYVQVGNRAVTLMWYRPKNDRPVLSMRAPHSGCHTKCGASPASRKASSHHVFVLSYVVTSSTGQRWNVAGHQQLIDTNTGSRVLKVIGGLNPHRRYRFSISAIGPVGAGPPARTGWIRPGS